MSSKPQRRTEVCRRMGAQRNRAEQTLQWYEKFDIADFKEGTNEEGIPVRFVVLIWLAFGFSWKAWSCAIYIFFLENEMVLQGFWLNN